MVPWSTPRRAPCSPLDVELWEEVSRNPTALLRRVPQARLDAAAADESYVAEVGRVTERLHGYLSAPARLADLDDAGDMLVAYFSLEFGLDAGIPLYSGGLGVLAGDHLKSASDLGVPLVGVGLLYANGYFRQSLGPDGGQRERYPETDWADVPVPAAHAGCAVVVESTSPRGGAARRGVPIQVAITCCVDSDVRQSPSQAITACSMAATRETATPRDLWSSAVSAPSPRRACGRRCST